MPKVNIEIPESYQFLFTPGARILCSTGGRGAGGSWNICRYLILKALGEKCRILCTREVQNSILESVHAVLKGQIEILGLSEFFDIKDRSITCLTTGSEFIFSGLYNSAKLKSLEGVKYCYCEEADLTTHKSLDFLMPTIRVSGSQLIFRWNTGYDDDPVYERFIKNTPKNCVVRHTTYRDNPWFNETLEAQRLADKAYRPHEYENIWEGKLKLVGRKIYPDFNETIHVKEFDMEYVKKHAMIFMGCDPAYHYYPAMLWTAVMPDPASKDLLKWTFDEYPRHSDLGDYFSKVRKTRLYPGSLSDLAREVYGKEIGMKIFRRSIDSRFSKGSGSASYVNDSQGMVAEWAKKENGGLKFFCPPEITIDTMRSKILDDLQYNVLQPLSFFNQPHTYVSGKCQNLIQTLKNHRLEEGNEREDERYKDFSDTLRINYAGIDGVKYVDSSAPVVKQALYNNAGSGKDSWMA